MTSCNPNRYKYPRTMHLPWSPGCTSDDKVLGDDSCFHGKVVVVTEKMDGENSTLYRDGYHARSVDSRHHPSRDWLINLWANRVSYQIDPWIRICGENMYAQHSIRYENLESYFLAFSVWDGVVCWRHDKAVELVESLGLSFVPVLGIGEYSQEFVHDSWVQNRTSEDSEGYVVRIFDSFNMDEFQQSVAKYVRENHVQTDDHWMHSEIKPNKLAEYSEQ